MAEEINIITKAQSFVENLLNEKLSKDLVYHNYAYTERVVKAVEEISEHSNLDQEDLEIVLLAAWFHATGYVESYEEYSEKSQQIAGDFLRREKVPPEKIEKIL